MTVEDIAIILGIVSLIVTVVVFFASIIFYLKGVNLQNAANSALAKVEERTKLIQTHYAGLLDKTLDATIAKKELSEAFDGIRLEESKEELLTEVLEKIGTSGEEERQKISKAVTEHLKRIQDQVVAAKESAEGIVEEALAPSVNASLLGDIYQICKRGDPAGFVEIMAESGRDGITVAEHLKDLLEKGLISSDYGTYALTAKGMMGLHDRHRESG